MTEVWAFFAGTTGMNGDRDLNINGGLKVDYVEWYDLLDEADSIRLSLSGPLEDRESNELVRRLVAVNSKLDRLQCRLFPLADGLAG
jgi:hypothetical protein